MKIRHVIYVDHIPVRVTKKRLLAHNNKKAKGSV